MCPHMLCLGIITIITRAYVFYSRSCSVCSRKRRWRWPKPRIFWRATPTRLMTLIPQPCLHTPWLYCAARMLRWPCAASTTWQSHKVLLYSSLWATRSSSHWKFLHLELSKQDSTCFTRWQAKTRCWMNVYCNNETIFWNIEIFGLFLWSDLCSHAKS